MSRTFHRELDEPGAVDLGSDHWYFRSQWSPDRKLNPQYADVPDIPWCGITIYHYAPDGTECAGHVTFDLPDVARMWPGPGPRWQVVSWEPLHLEPSILCDCGDHGFIRGGAWVPA